MRAQCKDSPIEAECVCQLVPLYVFCGDLPLCYAWLWGHVCVGWALVSTHITEANLVML